MRTPSIALLAVVAVVFPTLAQAGGASAPDPLALYRRIADDVAAGRPMVVTVHVALCDNDSQGIIPVRNRSICDGDAPARNMYWAGANGLAGMAKALGWRTVSRVEDPDGDVMVEQVWLTRASPGPGLRAAGVEGAFDVYVVGLAYRGSRIHSAFAHFLRAVHGDEARELQVGDVRLRYGGAGHVVGYVGHDYVMDVMPDSPEAADLGAASRGASVLAKGAFALACAGDSWIRPLASRANVYLLALNVYLAFPNAWAVDGILAGVIAGGDGQAIHRAAAKGFANGQGCGLGWALKALATGPTPAR